MKYAKDSIYDRLFIKKRITVKTILNWFLKTFPQRVYFFGKPCILFWENVFLIIYA